VSEEEVSDVPQAETSREAAPNEPAPSEEAAQAAGPREEAPRGRSEGGLRVAGLLLSVVVLALAVRGLVALLPHDQREPTVEALKPQPVRLLKLEAEALALEDERHARLSPVQEWVLSLEVGGRLLERPVQNGDALTADALILALDPEPFLAEEAAAKATLRDAQVSLKLAEGELARLKQLTESTATKRQVDQATADRDRALAAQAAAVARLRQATYRLRHAKLLAPAAGVISHLAAEPGQVVGPGQALGRFSRQDVLLVKLLVSAQVRRGVTLGSKAVVIDGRERSHAATLAHAAPVQAGSTGQFELEFQLPNPEGQLFAGEPVRVRYRYGGATPRLRLPRNAVYEEYGMWRALVPPAGLTPEGFRASSVPIVLGDGDAQAGWVEVLKGLEPGQDVLVPSRVAMVHEGQRVRLGEVGPVWLPPYAR
jgi:multidrug efflux system membrane fusion protein